MRFYHMWPAKMTRYKFYYHIIMILSLFIIIIEKIKINFMKDSVLHEVRHIIVLQYCTTKPMALLGGWKLGHKPSLV
jgi:hypothetical protein